MEIGQISERKKEQNKKAEEKKKLKFSLGSKTELQYAGYILRNIKEGTKKRNVIRIKNKLELHEMPIFSHINIKEILDKNRVYTVENTIAGDLKFPLRLTNGYYNSASFDRIDDNIGYVIENIEIRPQFLNNFYKFTTEDIRYVVNIRENIQNHIYLKDNYSKLKKFFFGLIHGAKICISNKKSDRNISIDFKSTTDFVSFLIGLYVEQGGRCAYSYIPIYPIIKHKYKISMERKNPTLSYNKNNILLIAVELNGRPCGQFLNKYISEENRQNALENGIFNQEYWNICTNLTHERKMLCELAKENDKVQLSRFHSESNTVV
jgi:hypothetical protein